jgi:hypothetical protein
MAVPFKVFLLSPARATGRRAAQLLEPKSPHALVTRLRNGSLTLGEAFTFMSSLYFRAKLAYARRFASAECIHVITPTEGLQSPDRLVTTGLLREFASLDIANDDRRYRRPLDRDLRRLALETAAETQVVLLGSIATSKYVEPLSAILGTRVHFPAAFVGRGDMSRGALLLRSIEARAELDYLALAPGVSRHGARPQKFPRRQSQ